MMKMLTANTSTLNTESNAALVSCYDGGDAEEDREPYGSIEMMCDLGSIAIPYPPDADGRAEVVAAEGVGGSNGRIIAAWDTRTASIAGDLEAGDRCSHAPHPNKSVQILFKGEKRTLAMVVEGKDGKQRIQSLSDDGFMLLVHGHAINVTKQAIAMSSANGQHGITISDSGVHVRGTVVLGGMLPIAGHTLATNTFAGWSAPTMTTAAGGSPMAPVFGVFVGL